MSANERIYLSAPHLTGEEQKYIQAAFDANWVAPLGPNVDAFEEEFCALTGAPHALALSSGTAALHLALILSDVGPGDEVLVSTLTFSASVNPIIYQFEYYQEMLGHLPGITFMPESEWGRHNRWLTVLTIDPDQFGVDRDAVRLALTAENIEARPVWKPMHLQPVFADYEVVGGAVAEDFFERGLCLPSGSSLTTADLDRIVAIVRQTAAA